MTRAGGVSTVTQTHAETRGAKNRKGEFDDRAADVGVGIAENRTNAKAGWSGGRFPPRTERRGRRTPKGRERETSREVADRPVRRERGGRQTDRPGRRWWSRKRTAASPPRP